jgi:serine/threonine-protein kinase
MRLQSGSRLGPYEIVATIGAGSMGEVYRATDTNLKRQVAIKVLPDAVAGDAERLVRFQREAEVLALLNHPNIAQIYGLEKSNGVTALVMELVEGLTLADRISHGAIPLPDALAIAKQIAEALEVAHDQGIIHRDLKPANIKIRPEGTVKVLDFGLAKAGVAGAERHAVQLTNSPTFSSPAIATAPGVILGTAAYMAPEQAKGRPADRRADMWAFGCVLYEMLTGRQTFPGEDVTEVLAAVMRGEPDCSALPKATPPAIETLIRRCLKKDPRQRLADASAARLDLDDAITGRAGGSADEPRARRGSHAPFVVAPLIGLILLVAGVILGWTLRPQTPPSPSVPARLEIALPLGDQVDLFNTNLALSPEGRVVAYVASREGISRLYVRALDSFEASPLAGTEGASHPFFSPDARWLGFFAQGTMKKIRVGGGPVQAIVVGAGQNGGASWGADGTIVYAPSTTSGTAGLARVSAEGGKPTVVTTPDVAKGEYSHRYPQILPGGRAVLFTALSGFGWDESRLEAMRLDTGERRLLVRGGHTGRYVPGGHLLYHRAGVIYVVPLDPDRLEVGGERPVAIVDDAIENSGILGAPFAVSATGSVAYVPAPAGRRQFERRLMWTDRQGRTEPLTAPVRNYIGGSAVSPDGRQVAVVIVSGTAELWVYDLARAALTRLTSDRSSSSNPVWTSDSRRLVYRNNQTGEWNLYWRTADASEPEERLTTGPARPFSCSPKERVLAFERSSPDTGFDIYTLSLDGDREPRPFATSPASERAPQFSPDGRWVAYASDEMGGVQVYVAPYPGPGRRWPISIDGGDAPQWNPKGGELFYENGTQTMVVDVKTGTTFNAGKPRVLYDGPLGQVAPDGQRFLTIAGVAPSQPLRAVRMILNWGNELNRGSRQ